MNQEKIGAFIAERRKAKKITQAELAEQLGVSNKTVSRWELGKCMPDISLFNLICKELDISVNELLSGEKLAKKDYQQRLEENIIGTIDYTSKLIKKRNLFASLFGLFLGIILIMTSMFIYPNDVGVRTYYLVITTFILVTIYFNFINKFADINAKFKYYVYATSIFFVMFIISILSIDFINVKINDIPPRIATPEFSGNSVKYDSLFYSAYKCSNDDAYTITFRNDKSVVNYCS